MLTKPLDTSFYYKGMLVKLNIPFNNILLVYELMDDELFDTSEKIEIMFNLVCECYIKKGLFKKWRPAQLDLLTKNDIVSHIFKSYINTEKSNNSDNKKVFDFVKDSAYIYSSFMSEYGIDLFDQCDRLDWRKFYFLFQGLSDKSQIKQIISIRSRPLPTPTKHNREEINHLIKMKNAYALEISDDERQAQFAQSLAAFADKYI